MCDYSAEDVARRDAVQNDELITGPISQHTRGFVGVADRKTAVCLRPGTELKFEEPIRTRRQALLGVLGLTQTLGAKVAVFRQVDMDQPATHHDALELSDGTIIKLDMLAGGQRATVLQLPAQPGGGEGLPTPARAATQANQPDEIPA